MLSRFKKFSLGTILAIFLFVGTTGVFIPEPAHAGFPVLVDANVPATLDKIVSIILEVIKAALINAGVKGASYMLRKVAYDSAVWIASGGKGQGAQAFEKGFGEYIKNVASEAGGSAIEELGRANGFNLCKVPDIKVDLALRVGLRNEFGGSGPPAKPACDTAQFLKNWSTGLSKFSQPGVLMKSFNVTLQVDDSDFGIYGQAREKIGDKVATQVEAQKLDRQEGQGFKSQTTNVSNQIETPAQDIKKVAGSQTPDETVKSNEAELNAALASGDIKVFPTILSIFLSTLGSNIINNFQTKGILPFGICLGEMGGADCQTGGGTAGGAGGYSGNSLAGASGLLSYEGGGITSLGRAAAQNFFSYLTAVKIKEPTRYDLISQLNSCPDTPGIYNCRAGDDLINAINQQLTIGQAIKNGILDGNKKLVPSDQANVNLNNDINCYRDAYCLNNVRVLRQVRILPLGFQLAVQKSDSSIPWTLKQVVDGFYDCGPNLTVDDPAHPYCHLIDPNWVLKAPLAKCAALANSASLSSAEVPNRLEECVDLQTCVQTNPDGSCSNYAYCTREKNTWKFPADSCSSQFATCRSYRDLNGRTVSYLQNTVDKSFCTSKNVGCQAYSLSANSNGWQDPKYDPTLTANSGIYLNNQVQTGCPASAAGCSAFKVASSTSVQLALRKAPDYLKCYDSNPATPAIDWPTDAASLATITGSPDCSKYAGVCTAEEQGCNWYTPVSSIGTRVPGKFKPAEIVDNQVIWNDQCDAKCVGYNVYREMPTNYSNGEALSYIIPSSGKTCTAQENGCTSFTNLSTTTGRGEGVEYFTSLRSCLKPSETPNGKGKTYITYEGSATAGFQLKTYVLLPNDDASNGPLDAPKYFFKDPVELQQLKDECTEDRYKKGIASLDCRQFNDDAGHIYYRLLSHTIPVTSDCTPYRINDPAFYTDSSVITMDACLTQSGFWDTTVNPAGVCKMCLSGGKYKNGVCIYEGLAGGVANNAGTSGVCSAAADTCRAYKGNAGNNIQNVFYETFESQSSISNWVGSSATVFALSTVSTHVGEHSLGFNGPGLGSITGEVGRKLTLEIGKTYDLTFWASSNAGSPDLKVNLIPADGSPAIPFGVVNSVNVKGNIWQQYHLGPVEYLANTSSANLDFKFDAARVTVYLDNIRLVKIADLIYLDKKTLSVDPLCNSHPDDGLPGEALGCSAYTDPQNRHFYLTNFSSLCREGAVGCTGLFDTQNTVSPLADSYNVWFVGGAGTTQSHNIPANGSDAFSCVVPAGQTGCYVNITGHSLTEILGSVSDGSIVANDSTIMIPPDTDSTHPIYLVANQSASCSETDLGCTFAGLQSYNSAGVKVYVTTTIKNDPSQYTNTLCQIEAVGCSAYSDGAEVNYFKDPVVSGQKFCEYRTNVLASGGTVRANGWFQKNPVGVCANNAALRCTKSTATSDCGGGSVCTVADNVPCDSAPFFVADNGLNLVQKLDLSTGAWTDYSTNSLNGPAGVAVDSAGNVYVADTRNNRIQKLTLSTGVWTTYGGTAAGSGAGQFKLPAGVAVDLVGNVYVADTGNSRIQKLTLSSGVWSTYGGTAAGSSAGQFSFPYGVAVDSAGNIYVADYGNNRIQKLTLSSGVWTTYGGTAAGSGAGQFSFPSGITVDSSGNIYVADSGNNRIQKFSPSFTLLISYGTAGSGPGQFNFPSGVAVDSAGNIYVADPQNHRIQELTLSSGVWTSFGIGRFNLPSGVALAPNFKRSVSLCPADQNRCTEFVDNADVNKSGVAKAYYLIKDDKVTEGDCSGQVSQKAGCVLFNQTDNVVKSWHSTTTYADSNSRDGALVVPKSDAGNDANIIMKVVQDRECGQWLKPLSYFSNYDEQSNSYKDISWGNLSLCDANQCALDNSPSILDANLYRQRSTGWYALDYDGYSIPGNYPVEQLSQVNFAPTRTSTPDWRLVKPVIVPCVGDNCSGEPSTSAVCPTNNTACGRNGWCVNKQCVVFPDGSQAKQGSTTDKQICRAYPENDSPFPSTPRIVGRSASRSGSSFFRNAHVCDEDRTNGDYQCECDYRKVQYGDVFTKYWKYDDASSTDRNPVLNASQKASPPPGICLGGFVNRQSVDNQQCTTDSDCGTGGVCELLKSSHSFLGLRGFCLEKDSTRHLNSDPLEDACLTWYPIESLSGAADINNQHTEALGDWQIQQANGGQYCAQSSAAPAPATVAFPLSFSPAGISLNNPTHNSYNGGAQGYGEPRYQAIARTYSTGVYDNCVVDLWGGHSSLVFNNGCFNSVNGAACTLPFDPTDQTNYGIDPSLGNINIDDIEELDVILNRSSNSIIGNSPSDSLQGSHNISDVPTIFKFPNARNQSDFPRYYNVTTQDRTGQPNGPIGAVTGGFYRDSGGVTHFIMLYTASNRAPSTANPITTGIDLPNSGQVSSVWVDGASTYLGLKGTMSSTQPFPNLTDKNGNDIWSIQNNSILDACPIRTSKALQGSPWNGAAEPVLWHAFKMDFGPKFNKVDTIFCGRWDAVERGQPAVGGGALPRDCKPPSSPGGSVSGGGDDSVYYTITLKLRQYCKSLADARINYSQNNFSDPNRTIPWTNHLWNLQNGRNNFITSNNINYAALMAPFGSLNTAANPGPDIVSFHPYSPSPCETVIGSTINGAVSSCPGQTDPDANFVSDYVDQGKIYSNPQDTAQVGVNRLAELYADTAGHYLSNGGSYVSSPGAGVTNRTMTNVHFPPQIHPLGAEAMVNKTINYVELPDYGFSINNSTGTIRSANNTLSVKANFFMFANENQMPIRQVAIDWGDGQTVSPLTGYFRNKRGLIASTTPTEACEPTASAKDYGHIKDVTCDNAFYNFSNYYACLRTNAPGYTSDSTLCNPNKPGDFPDGCCIFNPKVQVKDNWGWCNGNCSGPNSGCYDQSWDVANSGADGCDLASPNPWTPFQGGQVIVKYIK